MSINVTQLLTANLADYESQLADAKKRLFNAQRSSIPDKVRVARCQRSIEFIQKQVDATRAALARAEAATPEAE